jgi:hypothetical protein
MVLSAPTRPSASSSTDDAADVDPGGREYRPSAYGFSYFGARV